MKVQLLSKGEVVWEGSVPKADGICCRVEDGKAQGQMIFDGKEMRAFGDGGGSHPTWELEVAVPRVKEPKK